MAKFSCTPSTIKSTTSYKPTGKILLLDTSSVPSELHDFEIKTTMTIETTKNGRQEIKVETVLLTTSHGQQIELPLTKTPGKAIVQEPDGECEVVPQTD